MWVADKVEKDLLKEESTIDEETLVFSKFRQAIGDGTPSGEESDTAGTNLDLPGSQEFVSTPPPAPRSDFRYSSPPDHESIPEREQSIDAIFGAPQESFEPSQQTGGDSTNGSEQERGFAVLLEQFLESVQSGNDNRTELMASIIHECNSVLGSGAAAEDYKEFCTLLTEFLQYVSSNQYFDDIRVMNILSNIQDPFAQWARTKPNNRTGVLNTVNDTLRDFKTMFE
jgi:hypothetical protein